MPRIKPLNHFPDRYAEIIRQAALEGKQTIVPVDSIKQGRQLRGHFYAYLGALKAAAAEAALQNRPLTAGEVEIEHLSRLAPTVMAYLEDTGRMVTLTFQSREHSWQAKALAKAETVAAPSRPTATILEPSFERLLQIQQEIDEEKSQ